MSMLVNSYRFAPTFAIPPFDNFNRADNASMGAPWVPRNTNVMRITGNQAVPSADTVDVTMQYGDWVHGENGYVQAKMRCDNGFAGIQGLITTPFRNEIEFVIRPTGTFALVEHNNGTEVDLDEVGGAGDVEYLMRMEWEIGETTTTVRGYVDGDLTCEGLTSNHITPGNVGISSYRISNTLYFDDFQAGDLVDTVPEAPTALDAIGGDTQVSLTWVAPADGGDPITDYVVQWRTTAGPGSWNTFSDGTSTATSAIVTGLTNGTSYDFQVAAVNGVGQGAYSATDTATPSVTYPSVVTSNTEVGTSMGASNAVTLPSGVVTGNLLLAIATNDNPSTTDISTPSSDWVRIHHQVQGSNIVKMAVFAKVATGSDSFAVSGAAQDYTVSIHRIQDHAVVDPLFDILVASFASTSNGNVNPPNLNLIAARHWLILAAAGVDATTGNTITGVPSTYTQIGSTLTSASSTSSVLQAVAQKNVNATSEDPGTFTNTSRPYIGITIGIPYDVVVPSAPTLAAPTPGSGQMALSWTPTSTGGAPITDYVVEYRTTSGPGAWNDFAHSGTATTTNVTGLTNDVSYDFRVAAVNSAGTGAYSSTQTATPTSGGGGSIPTVPTNGGYFNEIGTTSTPTLSRPSGWADGDDFYALIATEDSAVNVITSRPSGWTAASGTGLTNPIVDTVGNDMRGFLERYDVPASPPASWQWTLDASLWTSIAGILVRGGGAPELFVIENAAGVGSGNARIPAITTSGPNRLLVAFVWTYENGPASSASGWSEPAPADRMVFHKDMVSAGTSPAQGIVTAVGATRWASVVFAIPPA